MRTYTSTCLKEDRFSYRIRIFILICELNLRILRLFFANSTELGNYDYNHIHIKRHKFNPRGITKHPLR